MDAKEFRIQIIRHQEDHVFSIAQLRFQFNNQIEEAFEMADRVTEKSIVEEEKRIKGAVDHNIKMQVERKKPKRKVGEGTSGSGSASVAPPGALDIESDQKIGSGDEGVRTESKDVIIFIVCLIAFISHCYFNI